MDDKIDYIERAALENIRSHIKNADDIAKEAQSTLVVLMAAAGAAIAYSLSAIDAGMVTAASFSAGVLAIYISILAIVLVIRCMMMGDLQAPTNEPKNLDAPELSLETLRIAELQSIQKRIDLNVERNNRVADQLNRVRGFAAAGPIICVCAFYLWPCPA